MEQAKKGSRKALWAAVAIIAIAAAGAVGYKITLEKSIASQLEKRGGKADSVTADFLGRIHLTNLSLPLKNGTNVEIGSVEGRPKFLFLTGQLDASDIKTQFSNYKISIPNIKIDDADFDIATLRETFGNSDLTPAQRISRFSAKSVVAPEIHLVQTIAGKDQNVTYKDVRLDDIREGHVAHYAASGALFDMVVNVPGPDGKVVSDKMTGTMGQSEGEDIDGVFIARLYTETAGPDDKDAKPVYGPFFVKDIVMKSNQVNLSYDEISSQGFTMRLPQEPLTELVDKIAAVQNPDDLTPAEQRAFFLRLVSLFDMIGKGDVEIKGLKIDPTEANKQKGEIAEAKVAFDNSRMDATVKGISVAHDSDYIKVDEASIKGFSWGSSSEALKKLAALSDEDAENFPFTTLMPEFGTMRVTGVDADLPNDHTATEEDGEENASSDAAVALERLKFSLKNYEIALLKPRNGIPTDMRVTYEDMSFPVPPSAQHELYDKLRKLGYDKVTLSSNVEASWDEEKQNLVIKDISVSGQDMGSIALSGLFGGFTEQIFSGDKVMMQVAALGIKAREASLKVEEKGLIAKALKFYADENNMSEEEARQALTMGASIVLEELAADRPQLQQAAAAFWTFLEKPNVFEVNVTSIAEKGIGMLEMVAASQDPIQLLDKVKIEARAE